MKIAGPVALLGPEIGRVVRGRPLLALRARHLVGPQVLCGTTEGCSQTGKHAYQTLRSLRTPLAISVISPGREAKEVLYPRCCGLDVHKKRVVACALLSGPEGQPQKVVRRFGTMTADLLQLAGWLQA
jgi:hypothetical protein